jgi:TonB-linked SusC/RagA family outer membrane protein
MQFSFAQEKTVTGVVSDKTGPLPGANIVVKGTTRSAQADFDGKFSISAKVGETLVISFTGYNNSTVTVGAANNYKVTLSDGIKLDEVVILGYDKTASKPKSVAATTTVSSESLKNRPNVTVLQSLQGNAPGLSVFTSSGSPGSAKFDLLIRGTGSVNSSTDPLYVVDGIPTNAVVFRNINPEDIESISVLRDAAATSIYGSRSANGVVVIKTKGGKFDTNFKVSYSSTYGISDLPDDKYNIMNSTQLLTLQRDLGISAGGGANTILNNFLGRDPNDFSPLTDQEILRSPNTDWRNVFFNTSETQSHNLSFTSGGKNLSNFTSVSYLNQKGVVNNTNFQRFTFRSNFNGKSNNEKFTFGSNLTLGFSKRNQLGQETNANINNNVIQNPLQGSLTGVPYYAEGFYPGSGQALFDLIGTNFDGGNSVLALQDLLVSGNQPNRYNELKILANFNTTYKLTKEFSVNSKLGVDYNVSDRGFARAPWSYLAIAVRETNSLPYGGFEDISTSRDFGFNSVTSLQFSKQKGKHSIDAGIYAEYIKAHATSNVTRQNGLDLLTYDFWSGAGYVNLGTQYPQLIPSTSAAKADAGLFSYFGTVTYDYDSRFGIDVVARRDASYRFIDDKKWGTFGSVGARWNIDQESFMKNSAFNMLKLRASWGIQGNQNLGVPAYGANPLYTNSNLVRDLIADATGYNNSTGYDLSQFGNNTLQWEEQTMTDVGVDFGIWKDRISGTIDFYNKKTDQLLTSINLSSSAGAGSALTGNNGSLQNRGVEVSLRYKAFRGDNFNLEFFANGSYNKNKYLSIERTANGDFIDENGSMVNEYFMVPYAGVNTVGYTDGAGVFHDANGNYLFLDIDGNLTETPSNDTDRRRTGKSNTPIYQGGFGFNADYKGFFLDTQFAYALDVWRLDYTQLWLMSPSFIEGNNMSADILNAWTPTNTNTDVAALDATNFDTASDMSDKWLKDASYIRLKSLNFGYSFSKDMLKRSFMTSLKIFVQAENLKTWTKWRGFDPDSYELTNLGRFPAPRTVSFGLNVEF